MVEYLNIDKVSNHKDGHCAQNFDTQRLASSKWAAFHDPSATQKHLKPDVNRHCLFVKKKLKFHKAWCALRIS